MADLTFTAFVCQVLRNRAFLQLQDVLMTKCRTTLLLYPINTTKSIQTHTDTGT